MELLIFYYISSFSDVNIEDEEIVETVPEPTQNKTRCQLVFSISTTKQ